MRAGGRCRIARSGALIGVAISALMACKDSTTNPSPSGSGDSVIVVAAGDIACGSEAPAEATCEYAATAGLATAADPDAVLALGDLQYEHGALDDFNRFYHPTWGVLRGRTYPVPGNHEYEMPGASGYFDYFNGVGVDSGRAGHRSRGYYGFTLGSWRVLALNSYCQAVGGCGAGSPQERWVRAELAADTATCTMAIWHHASFSSSHRSPDLSMRDIWQALQEANVDLVLASHTHNYERFAPMNAAGVRDNTRGIPSIVIGTGGKDLHAFVNDHPHRLAGSARSFGILRLILRDTDYSWEFIPVEPDGFTDSGSGICR